MLSFAWRLILLDCGGFWELVKVFYGVLVCEGIDGFVGVLKRFANFLSFWDFFIGFQVW